MCKAPTTPPGTAWPYRSAPETHALESFDAELIPYFRWANRGPAAMRVFIPVADK